VKAPTRPTLPSKRGNQFRHRREQVGLQSVFSYAEDRLHAGSITTEVNEEALAYMQAQGLSAAIREQLSQTLGQTQGICRSLHDWHEHLARLEITDARHKRIATEGALLGSKRPAMAS
jgi:hypothetical protein